ncbi:hypothetical protein, partial [Ruegeria sp. Ofav3-42]|uniref:hypothetical protein n=1 Tax=Ruegeria sp. Ofav3-42 TaxID=2917759 RepID=UPI001EF6C37B
KTNAFCASVNLAAFIASVPFPSKGFVPENSNHKWQENRVSEQTGGISIAAGVDGCAPFFRKNPLTGRTHGRYGFP